MCAVCQAHVVKAHTIELQLVPDILLQLYRDGAVTAASAENKSSIVV